MSCSWRFVALALILAAPGVAHAQSPGAAPAPAAPKAAGEAPPADEPAAPTDDDISRKHYEDGQAAAQKGDWAAAYRSYRAAYAIKDDSVITGALGTAAHQLGKYSEAAEYLTSHLQKAPATLAANLRAGAESMLAAAKKRVGTLTIEAPAGAEIFVDHVIVGKAPLGRNVFVEPGQREVEARLDRATAQRTVSIDKGKSEAVLLVFGAQPAAAQPGTGTPPGEPGKAGPGPRPGEVEPPAPAGGPNRAVLVSGATLGASAALAGAIMLGVSRMKVADEEQARSELVSTARGNVCAAATPDPRCTQVRDAGTTADALTNGGAWLLLGAGATGVATAIYFLVTKKPAASPVEAALVIGPRGGGGGVSVRW